MAWQEAYLDAVLVPAGLALLVGYHVRLMYRIRYHPLETVIGINHINRRAWVEFIMHDIKANALLAIHTIRNSIMASTLLASTAITLSGVVGTLATGRSQTSKNSSTIVLGSEDPTILLVKYLCILICYLAAFVCNVQAIRYSSHVSFLIAVPMTSTTSGLTPEYINRLIHRSTNFFSLGLRAYYFSFPLLLWLFGPVPHFVCCLIIVLLLNIVDGAKEFKYTFHYKAEDGDHTVSPHSDAEKGHKLPDAPPVVSLCDIP